MNRWIFFISSIILFGTLLHAEAYDTASIQFPNERPKNGNFNRPGDGDVIDISTPGFCWWRAGERGKVFYRLHILGENGQEVYTSEMLLEPAHVIDKILPAGIYSWTVDALTSDGIVHDIRPASTYIISESAVALPWIAPQELLNQIPREHPRLLFPKSDLSEIRESLNSVRKIPFTHLKNAADKALDLPLVKRPDFDRYVGRDQYAAKRTAYRADYHRVSDTYLDGVVPLALTYLLTDNKKYGEAARAHILHFLDWGVNGVMSVQDPRFDEVGLRIARALPVAYDWCYDIFSSQEREQIEKMIIALGNKLLERMQTRDFLYYSSESHDGRVPGYLLEFAIVMAECPDAENWMDYALKAILTVFPHWAGKDGGWAEGVEYALSYNDRFITPLQSLYVATGYDLWRKPFFRKFPYFLMYCISPRAEITPFGDQEHLSVDHRIDQLRSLLLFYALRYQDPTMRWWIDLLEQDGKSTVDGLSTVHQMIFPDTVPAIALNNMPQERAFFGIGWSAMHSDFMNPDKDLMVLFKSSPFGPVSHSHADQNSFAILKGGRALAIPAGERYPQHGSPFHTKYTRLTLAHNALLIDGRGQQERNGKASGKLINFESKPHIGYAAGDARDAYGAPVQKCIRHVVLIRPSLILIMDDLETSEPVEVEWLMHAKEKFDLNENQQFFVSQRDENFLKIYLITPLGFDFQQTDAWPIDPQKGYPMVKTEPPARQWHFMAQIRKKCSSLKIAAIMIAGKQDSVPDFEFIRKEEKITAVTASFEKNGEVQIDFNLNTKNNNSQNPFVKIRYNPLKGETEYLTIP